VGNAAIRLIKKASKSIWTVLHINFKICSIYLILSGSKLLTPKTTTGNNSEPEQSGPQNTSPDDPI
jgi:hypothetical protein